MAVHIVAARSLNNVIGKGMEIPWRVKGEQKLFKEITMGGTLIMGRITYETIGRPLPGRKTIIVTRNTEYQQADCQVVHSVKEAMDIAESLSKPIYIVGGGELYRQCLPDADFVHLTTIATSVDGDVFFPEFPNNEFQLIEEKTFTSNIDYTYQLFKRELHQS